MLVLAALAGCSVAVPPEDEPFVRPAAEGVRLAPTASGSLGGRVVVVDAGHAGVHDPDISGHLLDMGLAGRRPCYTSGTTATDGTPEHALNHAVALRLAGMLRARGSTVILTRGDDASIGPCNDDRARIANRAGADLLVSIHGDGDDTGKRGFHIIYAPNMEGGDPLAVRSRSAALVLAESLAAGTKLPPSNYKGTPQAPIDARTNLGALSMLTRTPGILVELGNLKNPADWALLSNDRVRDDVAAALATGVDKVLAG